MKIDQPSAARRTAPDSVGGVSRREFLRCGVVAGAGFAIGSIGLAGCGARGAEHSVFVAAAGDYRLDFGTLIGDGLIELGLTRNILTGKRVLLKPNLVESSPGHEHINTHPAVLSGAIAAFLRLGAAGVVVGEGAGHCRDTLRVVAETGVDDVLREDRIAFIDLNYDEVMMAPNRGGFSALSHLVLPRTLGAVDLIVSMPKLKTHHWAGVTLSMKNLFGVMPGSFYGWPKNVLHHQGIDRMILDIAQTVRPQLAIVDGVVGMEGDGPIMGTPKQAGVLVMGRTLPAVDATCARLMGIDPEKVDHLRQAGILAGGVAESRIEQRGERPRDLRSDFELLDFIPAQRGIRLG